jgi:hypothetical protein
MDLLTIFLKEICWDLTILTDEEMQIKAHKNVLISRYEWLKINYEMSLLNKVAYSQLFDVHGYCIMHFKVTTSLVATQISYCICLLLWYPKNKYNIGCIFKEFLFEP